MNTNELQTIIIPATWTITLNEDGTKTYWYLDVEIGMGNFNGFYPACNNFYETWNRNYEEAINLDYVVSVRPGNKDMPIDEKLLTLKKFINEPLIK